MADEAGKSSTIATIGKALLGGGATALAGAIGSFGSGGGVGAADPGSPKFNVNQAMGFERPLLDSTQSQLGRETPIREPFIEKSNFDARKIDRSDPLRSIDIVHQDIANWMTTLNKNVNAVFSYVRDIKRDQDGKFKEIRSTFETLAKRDKELETRLEKLRKEVHGMGGRGRGDKGDKGDAGLQGTAGGGNLLNDLALASLAKRLAPFLAVTLGVGAGLDITRKLEQSKTGQSGQKMTDADRDYIENLPWYQRYSLKTLETLQGADPIMNDPVLRRRHHIGGRAGDPMPDPSGPSYFVNRSGMSIMHSRPMAAPQSGAGTSGGNPTGMGSGGGRGKDPIGDFFRGMGGGGAGGRAQGTIGPGMMGGFAKMMGGGGGSQSTFATMPPPQSGFDNRFGNWQTQDNVSRPSGLDVGNNYGPTYMGKNMILGPTDLLASMRAITTGTSGGNPTGSGGGGGGGGRVGGIPDIGSLLGGGGGGGGGIMSMLGGFMKGGGVGGTIGHAISRMMGGGGHTSGGNPTGSGSSTGGTTSGGSVPGGAMVGKPEMDNTGQFKLNDKGLAATGTQGRDGVYLNKDELYRTIYNNVPKDLIGIVPKDIGKYGLNDFKGTREDYAKLQYALAMRESGGRLQAPEYPGNKMSGLYQFDRANLDSQFGGQEKGAAVDDPMPQIRLMNKYFEKIKTDGVLGYGTDRNASTGPGPGGYFGPLRGTGVNAGKGNVGGVIAEHFGAASEIANRNRPPVGESPPPAAAPQSQPDAGKGAAPQEQKYRTEKVYDDSIQIPWGGYGTAANKLAEIGVPADIVERIRQTGKFTHDDVDKLTPEQVTKINEGMKPYNMGPLYTERQVPIPQSQTTGSTSAPPPQSGGGEVKVGVWYENVNGKLVERTKGNADATPNKVTDSQGRPLPPEFQAGRSGGFDKNGNPVTPYIGGQLQMDGQSYRWGSGMQGHPHTPYGDFYINIGNSGTKDRVSGSGEGGVGRLGQGWANPAVAGLNTTPEGNMLGGEELHSADIWKTGKKLDQLYTQGCFAIAPEQWPAFKGALLEKAKNEGKLMLHLHAGPDGQPLATITSTKDGPLTQGGQPTQALTKSQEYVDFTHALNEYQKSDPRMQALEGVRSDKSTPWKQGYGGGNQSTTAKPQEGAKAGQTATPPQGGAKAGQADAPPQSGAKAGQPPSSPQDGTKPKIASGSYDPVRGWVTEHFKRDTAPGSTTGPGAGKVMPPATDPIGDAAKKQIRKDTGKPAQPAGGQAGPSGGIGMLPKKPESTPTASPLKVKDAAPSIKLPESKTVAPPIHGLHPTHSVLPADKAARGTGTGGRQEGWEVRMKQAEARHEVAHGKNLYSGGPAGKPGGGPGPGMGARGTKQVAPAQAENPGGGKSNDQVGPTTNSADQDSGGAGDRGTGDQADADGIGLCSV